MEELDAVWRHFDPRIVCNAPQKISGKMAHLVAVWRHFDPRIVRHTTNFSDNMGELDAVWRHFDP